MVLFLLVQRRELPAPLPRTEPTRTLVERRRAGRVLRDLPIGAEPQTAVRVPFVASQGEQRLGLRRILGAVDADVRPERRRRTVGGTSVPFTAILRGARREQ